MLAQDDKKKKTDDDAPIPVYNYVIDDPMDQFHPQTDLVSPNRYFLFPQFYSYWPIDNNDTILKYECYDLHHSLVNMDTLRDIDDVYFISFIKKYTDYTRTYIDGEGKPQPLPIVKILYKYERTGTDSWNSFDYTNNTGTELKEHKNEIVRTDTTSITNPANGSRQLTIRKYFRIEETGRETEAYKEVQEAAQKDEVKTAIHYYNVPEFYFHEPKKNKDTTLEFLCYDDQDSLLHGFENFDTVHYLSLYKSYIDSAHTYKDNNGQMQPLPVSSIIQRYDKIGKDKWMSIEYPGNKYTELKEFKSVIVTVDSQDIVDPVTGSEQLNIYNHYKVIK